MPSSSRDGKLKPYTHAGLYYRIFYAMYSVFLHKIRFFIILADLEVLDKKDFGVYPSPYFEISYQN